MRQQRQSLERHLEAERAMQSTKASVPDLESGKLYQLAILAAAVLLVVNVALLW